MGRVVIADDHAVVRQGLRRVLEQDGTWTVVGEAENGRRAVALAREHRPHVVVMDYSMPELNGLEATRQIRAELRDVEVLLLTMHDSETLVREILAAGARGYILKSDAGDVLLAALTALRDHRPYFTSTVGELVLSGYLSPDAPDATREILSPREREVVQLFAEGKTTKEVGDALHISAKTVETHRANLLRKLRLRTLSDLVRYAIRNKIVEP